MNLEQLADFLDTFDNEAPALEVGFDMNHTYEGRHLSKHPCGTAFCIGGWIQETNPETRAMKLAEAVMHVSPLSHEAAYDLCFPSDITGVHSGYRATPQQAAQAIRNAIKFDDPKWKEVMREPHPNSPAKSSADSL